MRLGLLWVAAPEQDSSPLRVEVGVTWFPFFFFVRATLQFDRSVFPFLSSYSLLCVGRSVASVPHSRQDGSPRSFLSAPLGSIRYSPPVCTPPFPSKGPTQAPTPPSGTRCRFLLISLPSCGLWSCLFNPPFQAYAACRGGAPFLRFSFFFHRGLP